MRDIKDEVIFVAQREYSSMTSTWMEHLVIIKGQHKMYQVANAAYDAIAEANDYFNEEKDDYDLPAEINGQKVLGVSDGFIIGGELGINMDNSGLEFNDPEDPELEKWLKEHHWDKTVSKDDLRIALNT